MLDGKAGKVYARLFVEGEVQQSTSADVYRIRVAIESAAADLNTALGFAGQCDSQGSVKVGRNGFGSDPDAVHVRVSPLVFLTLDEQPCVDCTRIAVDHWRYSLSGFT